MSDYVIAPPKINAAPIKGSDKLFPVRRVYCIGRNYAAHAIEMGHDPNREPPFFFQKNPDSIDFTGKFPYPSKTKDVHHEIEMVVALAKGGTNIAIDKALDAGYLLNAGGLGGGGGVLMIMGQNPAPAPAVP